MNFRSIAPAKTLAALALLGEGFTGGAAAQTANPGLVYPPSGAPDSFFGTVYLQTGGPSLVLGPSTSAVVLNSLSFNNYYNQVNGAAADIELELHQSTASNCSTGVTSTEIGQYEAKPGQTFQIAFPTGIVLKPAAAGQYWCLYAYTSIQNNPSSYSYPSLSYAGYVISGVAPASALPRVPPTKGVPPLMQQH
jgi:hypothetical protein